MIMFNAIKIIIVAVLKAELNLQQLLICMLFAMNFYLLYSLDSQKVVILVIITLAVQENLKNINFHQKLSEKCLKFDFIT